MSEKTERLFQAIEHFIAESRTLLDTNQILELSGLDQQVQALCLEVLQLSDEERLPYADRMQVLLDDLTALGDSMAQKRDSLAEEIRGLSHHKKASAAYRTAEASDKRAQDEE